MVRQSGRVGSVLLTAALVLYASALAAASLMPVSHESALAATAARRTVNNMLHVPAYGLLAWLWVAQFRAGSNRFSTRRFLAAGAIAAFGFGALMELAQRFVPGRKGTLEDFLLNGAGVCAAACLMWLYDRSRGKSPKSEDTPHASPGGRT